MKNIILTANGTQKADLVLKNASIVNVFTESIEVGDVAITDGKIVGIGRYEGKIEKDMTGRFVCPGFIDGHIHLESSMVTPSEFARAVIAHGTTAVITDPHEIANVAGCDPVKMLVPLQRTRYCNNSRASGVAFEFTGMVSNNAVSIVHTDLSYICLRTT